MNDRRFGARLGFVTPLLAAAALAAAGETALPRTALPPTALHVATFDSGFGGYLTAKSIEVASASLLRDYDTTITVHHYGDTKNLPYGEKTPDQIATLASAGVLKAFDEGADMVFIACNTASTQYTRIRHAVDAAYPKQPKPVISIIEASTAEAKRQIDATLAHQPTATFAILATPATVRSMVYPRQLAALYGASIAEEAPRAFKQPRWYSVLGPSVETLLQKSVIVLPAGRRVDVYQLAPANWVELIEHGADLKLKREAVHRDLGLLLPQLAGNAAPDVVGYFCTHYPILDGAIRADLAGRTPGAANTHFIAQGELMAKLFRSMAEDRLKGRERAQALTAAQLAPLIEQARASITISGANGRTTRALARSMFPNDPEPLVVEQDLGNLGPAATSRPQ